MTAQNSEIVVFGGGCFWCTEAVFLQLEGVKSVTSGYAGGTVPNPTYEEVSSGRTGHAEVVRIEYDPNELPFSKLLAVFFSSHDPTQLDRQGADVGPQYRSIILYTGERQRREAESCVAELTAAKKYPQPIVTEIKALTEFYPAEEYHRDFYAKNPDAPYARSVIVPKVEKLRREQRELLREQ